MVNSDAILGLCVVLSVFKMLGCDLTACAAECGWEMGRSWLTPIALSKISYGIRVLANPAIESLSMVSESRK